MRKTTSQMAEWAVSIKTGTRLAFENCKGGIFSALDTFGLQVTGRTALSGIPEADAPADIQCVKEGTKLLCRGKNLFDKNASTLAAIRNETAIDLWGSNLFPSGYDLRKIFPPSETVTVSFDVECVDTPSGEKPSDGSIIGLNLLGAGITMFKWKYLTSGEKAHCSYTFTVPQSLSGVTLRGYTNRYVSEGKSAYSSMILRNLQVELGEEETPYEPYYESEITVPCDLHKGDTWYPVTGKVIRRTAEKTLSEADHYVKCTLGSRTFFYTPLTGTPQGDIDFYGLCDRFTTGNYADTKKGLYDSRFGSSAFEFAFEAQTAAEVKAWVAAHPIRLVYALGTPRTETYPAEPICAPCGTVNVTALPIERSPELSAAMLVKF